VLFDDVPAALLLVSSRLLLCIAPQELKDSTVVQVALGESRSNPVEILVRPAAPQLLTRNFPDVDRYTLSDANVRNQDGTENDADHPATAGSVVTVYATGLGNPPLAPLYASWDGYTEALSDVQPLAGFVDSILQIRIRVPAQSGDGTPQRVPLYIAPARPGRTFLAPYAQSRPVAVYVR
jgi:uncharacterized protein (TIGR03437 family)